MALMGKPTASAELAAELNDSSTEPSPAESGDATGLSEQERKIIEFERKWWRYAGAKEQAINDLFGVPATRYYQLLNTLIDKPEALEIDPLLVKRLRRLRSTRQQARSARRLHAQ